MLRIRYFFIRSKANLSKSGSYSLHNIVFVLLQIIEERVKSKTLINIHFFGSLFRHVFVFSRPIDLKTRTNSRVIFRGHRESVVNRTASKVGILVLVGVFKRMSPPAYLVM